MDADVIVVGAGAAGACSRPGSAKTRERRVVLLLEAGENLADGRAPRRDGESQPVQPAQPAPSAAALSLARSGGAAHDATGAAPLLARAGDWRQHFGQRADRHSWRAAGFEDWAEAGCEGWSPDHVLPHFRMLEDDLAFGDEPWHGKGGPIPVSSRAAGELGAGGSGAARCRTGTRSSVVRRPECARRAGRVHLRHQLPRRPARLDRRRLSRARARPAESHHPRRRAGRPGAAGGQAGDGRAGAARTARSPNCGRVW